MTLPERVKADYETMNLTTGPHPMKLLRGNLPHIWRRDSISFTPDTVRSFRSQERDLPPASRHSKRIVFISLEDEPAFQMQLSSQSCLNVFASHHRGSLSAHRRRSPEIRTMSF